MRHASWAAVADAPRGTRTTRRLRGEPGGWLSGRRLGVLPLVGRVTRPITAVALVRHAGVGRPPVRVLLLVGRIAWMETAIAAVMHCA
jgi:hypothetical protein